jgi:cytoskeleton protein RodZ
MTERADQPATPEIPHGVPGKALAAQREAMGWTVEQVADQLKLAPRQVIALEAGDYAALPSPAVVRGFVRAYAKILRMDAAPLVAMIELDTPPAETTAVHHHRPQKPATFSESSRFPSHSRRGGLPLGWIAAAVVVVAAGAAAWHFGLVPGVSNVGTVTAEQAASTTVLNTPESASATVAQAPVHNPNVPLICVPSASAEATQPAAAPAATAPGDAGPATVAPVTAAPAAATAPAPAAPAPTATPAGGANALVMNVREDSWIEVRPAKGGAPLISRLVKAGSTETVEVNEPVNVVVGKPSAVSATLRGAAVELPLVPGKTISRVSLK